MRERFVANEEWACGLFDASEKRVVGGAGLHSRGTTDHLEIGYWIRSDASGQGLATEAGIHAGSQVQSRGTYDEALASKHGRVGNDTVSPGIGA